jgi:23S rRNA (guanosine2251-2'-O)-methyltransferase
VLVSDAARGREIDEIVRLTHARGIDAARVSTRDVTRLSRNGRQDQGVAADVVAPGMRPLSDFEPGPVALILDGITNPANVGMILRTATAAGIDAIVVPTAGVADLGPLVIKASAGVAFRAPIVRARTAEEAVSALRETHGYRIYGVDPRGDRSLYDERGFAARSAFVIGGEHEGYSVDVDERVSIPLSGGVDSLNAAVAAGVLCFELVRRRA